MSTKETRSVEAKISIEKLDTKLVLEAFVLQEHLEVWWGVSDSLVQAKPGGLYSLVWKKSTDSIDFASSGLVRSYHPGQHLLLDKMVYFNPSIPLLGPMSIDVRIVHDGVTNWLRVMQYGYQDGPHWDWYYEAVRVGWPQALTNLDSRAFSQSVSIQPGAAAYSITFGNTESILRLLKFIYNNCEFVTTHTC